MRSGAVRIAFWVGAMLASAPAVQAAPTPARAESASSARIGAPGVTTAIVAARILVAVDDAPATDRPAYAKLGQRVLLYAAVTAKVGGKLTLFTDAPAVKLKQRLPTEPMSAAPGATIEWQRVEPTTNNLSNGDGPTFHYEAIEYQDTPLRPGAGPAIPADVHPTLTPDHGNGVGTMRYRLVVTQGDTTITSPGPEARRGRASGGLTDAVTRVSIRRDDTFLGYLTEMYNQPYIWASAGPTDASHQSEHLEGSDCADLMVYAERRLGKRVKYTWTGGLPAITKLLASGSRSPDGIYRDARGAPLPFTKPGDLILFTRHVGALYEDRGVLGTLDDQDVIIHTLFDSPKEQAIADTGYADTPTQLRRFK